MAVNTFAVFLAVVIALISLGYTFLAYPQADDLERTGALRVFSPMTRMRSDYFNLGGRWAAWAIEYSAYRGGHVIDRYPVMLIALLVVGMIGCCCGISIVTGHRISERGVLAGGIVGYSFLWLSAPRGEPFYWFPAGTEYWLPLALGVILLWLLYNFTGWWSKIIVVTMAFLVSAIHEVYGAWIVGVLTVTWIVSVAKGKSGSGMAAAAALAGAIGTASVVLAPGIRVRAASTPHESLHDAFKQALHIEAFNLAHWTTIAAVLIAILLAVAHMRERPSWYDRAPLFIKTCLLAAIAPLPIVMLTMISYGLGGGMPARVYDGFYFLSAAAVATLIVTCGWDLGRWGAAKTLLETQWGSLLRSAVMILALAGIMSLPRFHAAFDDIDPAIRNRAVWEQRNGEIWAARNAGVRDVVVSERMIPLPILPTGFDMTEDPNWYVNQQMDKYFGLRSIRLSTLPTQPHVTEAKGFDDILSRPPEGISETASVQCDGNIDLLNGVPKSRMHSVISNTLDVEGWTAISAKNGVVPDEVFLTLSNASEKLYVKMRTVARPDVNKAFGQPGMPDSGFRANVDVSRLKGGYTLGISRVYQGKLGSCLQLNIPLSINR